MVANRVLLLGATGFIGRQCIDALLRADDVIVEAVSRRKPDWAGQDEGRLRWHAADVLDSEALACIVRRIRPSHAVHLAWYAGPDQIWTAPENAGWVAASLALARSFAASGGRRIVVSGSCAEYAGSGIRHEADATQPETPYGRAKRETHLALASFCETAGISLAWARLFHMYGIHENARRLVAGAIRSLLRGEPFACSDGGQVRDFLHNQDVAEALACLLWSRVEGAINIGSGEATSIRGLLRLVGNEIGRGDLLRFGARPRAINDPDTLLPDLTRQRLELGWSPAASHEERIGATVDWWRQRLKADAALASRVVPGSDALR